jgi:hypothetical protein
MAEREEEEELVESGRSRDEMAKKEAYMYQYPSLI